MKEVLVDTGKCFCWFSAFGENLKIGFIVTLHTHYTGMPQLSCLDAKFFLSRCQKFPVWKPELSYLDTSSVWIPALSCLEARSYLSFLLQSLYHFCLKESSNPFLSTRRKQMLKQKISCVKVMINNSIACSLYYACLFSLHLLICNICLSI